MSDAHSRLDPNLAEALAGVPKGPNGIFDLTDIPSTRVAVRAFAEAIAAAAPRDDSVVVEEHVAVASGHHDVPLRLLRPREASARPRPALLWFHGGGQVLGYAAQDDNYLTPLVASLDCVSVAVDYRLAPETPAPGAAEDGLVAYRWLLEHADALGIDPLRIGLAGASGGGGIAAATALMVRDQALPTPLFQALNYPMLDDRNDTPSSHEVTDLGVWDRRTNELAWSAALGTEPGRDAVPAYAVPARAEELGGLPPTFLAVGELDLFRDEDLDYARRLVAAGVPVDLHLYAGAFHAWDLFAPSAPLTAAFTTAWLGFLSRRFEAPVRASVGATAA